MPHKIYLVKKAEKKYIDYDACDDLCEEVNGLAISLGLAGEDEDLSRIAIIGLGALSQETWFDMHGFNDYAGECETIWVRALGMYTAITEARQQG